MSVKIEPFAAADLSYIRGVREVYRETFSSILRLGHSALVNLENEYAWTAWTEYGLAVACCGIANREAWALIDPEIRPRDALAIARRSRQMLAKHYRQDGPVKAIIQSKVPAAIRWATALGFKRVAFGRLWVFNGQ